MHTQQPALTLAVTARGTQDAAGVEVKGHPDLIETVCAVRPGDRIAQLILERIRTPPVVEVMQLGDTIRGAGGYGSTGTGKIGG